MAWCACDSIFGTLHDNAITAYRIKMSVPGKWAERTCFSDLKICPIICLNVYSVKYLHKKVLIKYIK